MFKIDEVKIGDIRVIGSICPCEVDVNFHFNINGERNIPKFLVTIHFDQIVGVGTKSMKAIKVEGPYDPAINTGQDNDDFWLNVNNIIDSEINHRLFNVPQEERNVVIEEIFKEVEHIVEILEIRIES